MASRTIDAMSNTESRVLTSEGFRNLLVAGAHRVIAFREELDRINVFPVPDRDTGTNLAATMRAVVEGLSEPLPSLAAVGANAASYALDGAQGNSGVILAQFFLGMREEITDSMHLTMERFVAALRCASTRAREALAQPREGTILTVINDVAEHLSDRVEGLPSFKELLDEGLVVAKRSLKDTTERLAALKKAGVVDAGALGFVHFLEGIRDFFHHGREEVEITEDALAEEMTQDVPKEISTHVTFRYCCEAVVKGSSIPRKQVILELSKLGDSVVVAGDATEIHAHVHTNAPAYVLEALSAYGTVVRSKIEDMLEDVLRTASSTETHERTGVALVADTVCDVPMEMLTEHTVHTVPVQISFGEQSLRDRVDITPRQFYHRLQDAEELPKTSQPKPADFVKLYTHLAANHEAVISVHVSPGLSGTWQSAKTAADQVSATSEVPIHILDSGSASVAEGFILWAMTQCMEAGLNPEQCVEIADRLKSNVSVYVYVPTVEYFVRGGRLSPLQGKIAGLLRLRPILTSEDGKLIPAGKAIGRRAAKRRLVSKAFATAKGMEQPAFMIGHSAARKLAEHFELILRQRYPEASIWITDTTPAIGCHAGPGGIAIASMDEAKLRTLIAEASD